MKTRFYLMSTGERIPWDHNRYGFAMVYCGRNKYGQRIHELRKPTPSQRRSIVLSCIRKSDGKPLKIHWLAEKLGVSDRTIQSDIRFREQKGFIRRKACYDENTGRQTGNINEVIIKATIGTGRHFNLKTLYQMSNPVGYRNWSWDDFKIGSDLSDGEKAYQVELLKEIREQEALKHWKYVKKKCRHKVKESLEPEM